MCVFECICDLEDDIGGFFFAELAVLANDIVDGFAIDIFHDEKVKLACLSYIESLNDIGVVEFCGGPTFFVEAFDKLHIAAEFFG